MEDSISLLCETIPFKDIDKIIDDTLIKEDTLPSRQENNFNIEKAIALENEIVLNKNIRNKNMEGKSKRKLSQNNSNNNSSSKSIGSINSSSSKLKSFKKYSYFGKSKQQKL